MSRNTKSERDENAKLDAFVSRPWAEVSPNEWKEEFQSFKLFPYKSESSYLRDFDSIVHLGLSVLQRHELWNESLSLANEALSDEIFVNQGKSLPTVHFDKSLSLIELGQIKIALEYFISIAKITDTPRERNLMYTLGIHLLIALIPPDKSSNATDIAIEFCRDLLEACKPRKKISRILDKATYSVPPTWLELHRSMTLHLKP